MAGPDFERIVQAMPGNCLVLSPDLLIVAVSDSYLHVTMTTRDAIVGKRLFDVFPDNPHDPAATGVANVAASLERVRCSGAPERMAVQKYDIRRPVAEGGGFEERYWSTLCSPVFADDRALQYIIISVEDVTELVRLEQRGTQHAEVLRQLTLVSERRHAQLLDAAPDAIVVVGEDGLIDFVNAQAVRLFGYTSAELAGRRLDLLLPERLRGRHAAHVARFLAEPTARPMGSGMELFGLSRDGKEIPIEVSLSPLRVEGGMTVLAAIRDISERRRVEAAARLYAERLASAVESMQDAFALFDASDRLVLCNSVYRHLLTSAPTGALVGESYERLLDAWLDQAVLPDGVDLKTFRSACLTRRHEGATSFDLRTRDGLSLRVSSRPTPEGGIVVVLWDLTDDERRADELRAARTEAEAASATKSDFLSSMSHELRTPLNAILGFAQLAQRDKKEPISPRNVERMRQILRGGEHLLRLIDDILDLSRIEARGVSMSVEPVNLEDVLLEVKTTLESMAAQQGIALSVDGLNPDLPMIAVDRVRFSQILMNFGSNAIKYNRPDGKVVFNVSMRDPRCMRVTISDTGMGIPVDKQDKLFQPFQRAGQEAGPIQGTGIGLVITRRLAQLMGGDVGFTSVPGKGSEFWVDIPTHALSRPSSRPPSAVDATRSLHSGDGTRVVLYVEDNPANVAFMKDLLGAFDDIRLVTASSAEEGMREAQRVRPEVILMDINLPGMSGVDALRALRELNETKRIPVIALTAAASERDRQKGRQAGFYRYLTKPIKVEELIESIQSVLDGGAGGAVTS